MINRGNISNYLNSRGLEFFGIASLKVDDDYQRYAHWIAQGKHAGMAYLERYPEIRKDPKLLFSDAKSVVVFGLRYADGAGDKSSNASTAPRVAKYALLPDYHKILSREGRLLQSNLESLCQTELRGRVLVDTGPLLERALAAQTNSFFIGKNTLAINPHRGSYFLLAELFIDLEIDVDHGLATEPNRRDRSKGGCGTCRRCQVHCPTGALDHAYELNANRCLSYWTIENRGPIPVEFWPFLAKYWYGCDICQDVCPYNRSNTPTTWRTKYKPWEMRDLFEIATMSQIEYEAWFGGYPMTRAKREGLMRNALIAMWASQHPRLKEAMEFARTSELEVLNETVRQMEAM